MATVLAAVLVSIHAPPNRKERLPIRTCTIPEIAVSIHAPPNRKERRHGCYHLLSGIGFQSTPLPTGRSDLTYEITASQPLPFQSTPLPTGRSDSRAVLQTPLR